MIINFLSAASLLPRTTKFDRISPMHRLSYKVLFLFTVLATLGGLATLFPREAASWPNILGYRSLCTFAPAATFFCFFLAGTSCFIRSVFIKDQSGTAQERFKKHRRSLIPLALVLIVALGFTGGFLKVKNQYTRTDDAVTAASEEGDY